MLPSKETVGYDQEVQEKYNGLISRRHELNLQLGAVNGEQNQILGTLGELVASGASFTKQTARLSALRLETEALEAGTRYIANQIDLLRRFNAWLTTR